MLLNWFDVLHFNKPHLLSLWFMTFSQDKFQANQILRWDKDDWWCSWLAMPRLFAVLRVVLSFSFQLICSWNSSWSLPCCNWFLIIEACSPGFTSCRALLPLPTGQEGCELRCRLYRTICCRCSWVIGAVGAALYYHMAVCSALQSFSLLVSLTLSIFYFIWRSFVIVFSNIKYTVGSQIQQCQ